MRRNTFRGVQKMAPLDCDAIHDYNCFDCARKRIIILDAYIRPGKFQWLTDSDAWKAFNFVSGWFVIISVLFYFSFISFFCFTKN